MKLELIDRSVSAILSFGVTIRADAHSVYTVDVELPRGTSRTVVLHLSEPAATGEPIVLRQPLVRPLHVTLDDAVCSWAARVTNIRIDTLWSFALSRELT